MGECAAAHHPHPSHANATRCSVPTVMWVLGLLSGLGPGGCVAIGLNLLDISRDASPVHLALALLP
eukprot:NODE_567_length_1347_cov_232.431433_g442_i0.p8 GENE.NODE_567_length_1347_cov_232.431433_g442_i0~~NODE_567_length_1347_cov_232.431433_g442_i0.p8  ORF type:complete len:66 (+),score=10.17 NODE_567_length_1347_cov_232.431433_g442_i0:987-1184(+)